MTQTLAPPSSRLNQLKWFLIFAVIAGMVVANLYFSQVASALRLGLGIIVGVAILFLAKTTREGSLAFEFLKAARQEMRKVVWPTRQETVQATLLVMLIVLVMSVILWALDGVFALIISAIIS